MTSHQLDLSKLEEAAKKAVENVSKSIGAETDTDLQIYERLKPSDFPELITKYGVEDVIKYIQHMEYRKAQHRK